MGRLTDFIRVAEGWEEGVAHALEQFAGAMVVPGREQMLHALKKAKADKLGKAVILTAAPVRTSAAAGRPASEASADSRSVTALATLVGPNPDAPDPAQASDVADTVRVLLSDVAAVDDVAQAQRVTSGTTGFTRAVTRDGEVVVAGVAAIGGSSLSQSDLSLASRRDKALHEVAELKAELADLDAQVAQARDVRDQARLAVDDAAQRRTELRLRIQQAEKALRGAVDRVASLSRQVTAMDERIAKTREDAQSHRLKLDDLHRALASAQTATGEHADFDDLTDRERELEQNLNEAREQEVSARIAWTEANRKAESLTRQAGLLHDNAREAAERRTRLEALNERRRRQMARIERIASDADAVAGLVAASIRNVVARREELQAAVSSHDEELKTLRAQRNEIEPCVAGLQRREHELDVDRERLAAAYGQLMQKVADAVGMGLDELVAQYGPDQPVPVLDDDGRPMPLDDGDDAARSDGSGDAGADGPADGDAAAPVAYRTVPYVRAEQVKRLEKAKRDLAALGKVNPLAAEEYEALEARNRYLNDQRNDVVNSRDDLMTLIRDLDRTMVEVFRSAFEDTAAAFEQVFATLFPGGTGRLRLENPDDLLTTGVLVEASPAGKRVKQLSLLSGGERSLTALALLFAIFTARPSPFYVMDEVEAALDDVNLTRLLNAFEQLRSHAQLIVITHQQRTMSIADALYGVTMRADGVTAVVSQKLKRAG